MIQHLSSSLVFEHRFLRDLPEASLYLVGGAVRDFFLKKVVVDRDYVAVNIGASELKKWLQAHGRVNFVGKNYGVFKFVPFHRRGRKKIDSVDIALPRTERSQSDNLGGYHNFEINLDKISLEEDLARRDFTINAMALDLRTKQLSDPFGGQWDLKKRLIRAVGTPTTRFHEDLSRLLRAIRLAAQLDFKIEKKTRKALTFLFPLLNRKRKAANGSLEWIVPRETIGRELSKAFAFDPFKTVSLLRRADGLRILIPELRRKDTRSATYLRPIRLLPLKEGTVAVALLLRALSPEKAISICQSLGFTALPKSDPNRIDPSEVGWILKKSLQFSRPKKIRDLPLLEAEKIFLQPKTKNLLLFFESIGRKKTADAARHLIQDLYRKTEIQPGKSIPTLITGDDLLALGFSEGPKIRQILETIRNAQLHGDLKTKKTALKLIKNGLVGGSGLEPLTFTMSM